MIIDSLKNDKLYHCLNDKLAKAFEFLQDTDLAQLEDGKYNIDGDKIFAVVQTYTTKLKEASFWEAHRQYVDIQCIIEGEELIGYTNISNLYPNTDYDESKDIIFLEGQGDFFKLSSGYFAILMPDDAHMPSIAVDIPRSVRKVVIKVKT